MTKKEGAGQDRNPWLGRLNLLPRTPQPEPPGSIGTSPVPPSRKNRKALTTWQDETALKLLKEIAAREGISQQALIAEGLNYVLAKYRKPRVAS